ncbi:hypothetical protein [Streptomyces sp. NPDC004726]
MQVQVPEEHMAAQPSSLFKSLTVQKGWDQYEVFKARFEEAAQHLAGLEGPTSLATVTIEKRQFIRWMNGEVRTAPRTDARRVLRHLFPGIPVDRLFAPAADGTAAGAPAQWRRGDGGHVHDDGGNDVMSAAASESARFAARAETTNVGPHTMEQLEEDIRRIAATYPSRPVGPLFHEVRALRNRAFELLEGRQPPAYTRDLYVAAGVLCGILANASFDLGQYPAAHTHARTAFLCGELAEHNGLRTWVRGLQALITYWEGRPRDAVRLAETGLGFTPDQGDAHIRLAAIRARALGQLQQHQDATAALRDADRMREQLTEGDDLPGGMMAFPRGKQLFYASSAYLWLGPQHAATAEVHAVQAVGLYEAAAPGQRRLGEMSLAKLDLAAARLGCGELDGAAEQIHDVLAANAARGTESVRKRLNQFARHLTRHPSAHSPAAIGLCEAIAAHQSFSPAELPPGGTP